MKMELSLMFIVFASSRQLLALDSNIISNEVFELSLEELLTTKVNLTGFAVQGLNLHTEIQTDNPFRLGINTFPSTVHVIDSKTIEARGLKNVVEASDTVPGIVFGESPSEPYSFSIRGFDPDAVNILYNGIHLGLSTNNMRPLASNNIERIEVIKGASVLSTEGATGGTINIIPKRASLKDRHTLNSINIAIGSYNSIGISGESSGPMNESMAYIFNVHKESSDGWVSDAKSDFQSINASWAWKVTQHLDWILSFDSFEDSLPGYWGTPLVPREVAAHPVQVVHSDKNLVIDKDVRFKNYNVSDYEITSSNRLITGEFKWIPIGNFTIAGKGYNFDADRGWKNAESYIFNSETSAVDRDRLLVSHDQTLTGFEISGVLDLQLSDDIRNSTSLVFANRILNFNRLVGFEPVEFFVDSVDFRSPESGKFSEELLAKRPDFYNQETASAVLRNSLVFNKKVFLNVGLRAEQIDFSREKYNFDGSVRVDQADLLEQTSLQTSMLYKANNELSVFANVGKVHDSLERALIEYGSNLVDFDPPVTFQEEIGVKYSNLDRTIESEISLYTIRKTNHVFIDGVGRKQNKAISRGFDFSANINFPRETKLGLTLASNQTEHPDFYDSNYERDVSGKEPINVPKQIAGLWFSKGRIGGLPFEVGGNIKQVSRRWANSLNTLSLEDYTIYNGFIAFTGDNYRVGLYGRNLFDKVYAPWADLYYPDQIILGPPRTFGINFRYFF